MENKESNNGMALWQLASMLLYGTFIASCVAFIVWAIITLIGG